VGNTVISRWKATGTFQGPLGDIQPNGKTSTVTGISWAEYEGGKSVREYAEWDALGMFRSLGVEGVANLPIAEGAGVEARH
jgi:hypothetical protein